MLGLLAEGRGHGDLDTLSRSESDQPPEIPDDPPTIYVRRPVFQQGKRAPPAAPPDLQDPPDAPESEPSWELREREGHEPGDDDGF